MDMPRRDYATSVERLRREWGEKFKTSGLAPQFIPYYNSGQRIEVDLGYEVKRGYVGMTTGWEPCFLLLLRRDSMGSSYCLGPKDKVLRVRLSDRYWVKYT